MEFNRKRTHYALHDAVSGRVLRQWSATDRVLDGVNGKEVVAWDVPDLSP